MISAHTKSTTMLLLLLLLIILLCVLGKKNIHTTGILRKASDFTLEKKIRIRIRIRNLRQT